MIKLFTKDDLRAVLWTIICSSLLIGFAIGWLVELLIDYYYWRRRRIDAEAALRAEADQLRDENEELHSQNTDFQGKSQHFADMKTNLQAREVELNDLMMKIGRQEVTLGEKETSLNARNAELATLATRLESRQESLNAREAGISDQSDIITSLKSDLASAQATVNGLEAELAACKSATGAGVVAAGGVAAALATAVPNQKDNLKKMHGIGPKIEGLLNAKGIQSFADLANANPDTLEEILEEAGSRFRLTDPSTWPTQALLAASDKWDELKAFQDSLDWAGRPGSPSS